MKPPPVRAEGDAVGSALYRAAPAVRPPRHDLPLDELEVASIYPRIMTDREMDAGAWCCEMAAGLIQDIPTVAMLIDRIMAEAEEIIAGRVYRLIAQPARVTA
jgi:NAD(P)H-dependent flavin oxidoreductase YrpB (nitropropane dioxygenase family)